MKNSFASSVFLRGMVTGREITKKRLLNAISINPNGLMHRTSPKTSPTVGFSAETSLPKTSPLKETAEKKTITKMTILFIQASPLAQRKMVIFPFCFLLSSLILSGFAVLPIPQNFSLVRNPFHMQTADSLPAACDMKSRGK